MNHIRSTFPDIGADKKDAITKIHTSLLFIKNKLDKAIFSGKINKQEFTTRLTGAMKWFQEANRLINYIINKPTPGMDVSRVTAFGFKLFIDIFKQNRYFPIKRWKHTFVLNDGGLFVPGRHPVCLVPTVLRGNQGEKK
ncbi:MAG: hypothetical protein ACKVE4_02100 [Dissulfuribacterales bacterium]